MVLGHHALAADFRVLAWDQEIAGRNLALSNGGDQVVIQNMHPTQRTPSIRISSSPESPLVLLALDRMDEEGNPKVEKVAVPQGMKRPLMLLLPDPDAMTGLKPLLIEDDSADFPWASIRLINTTGKKLAFTYEKKARILPTTWKPLTFSPGGSTRNFEAKVFTEKELNRPIYSAIWEHREDFRILGFIVASDNPRLGPIAIKMIYDDRRAIETAEISPNP